MNSVTRIAIWTSAILVLFINSLAAANNPAPVHVILWFDTEDYLLPADDDACKRLAEMLTQRHIRATFKTVGEKARVLQQRGRRDVIRALQKHDIAYHTDFHSAHPTVTEYLADCGWLDGVAEFVRREGPGAETVRRVFSVKTLGCYGQPGSSWAPQAIGALKQIGVAPHGVPCYVDDGDHVGLDHKPFWYAGALTVYGMGPNCTRMDLHNPAAVEPAQKGVSRIAERLQLEGGGLISIYYHPCEWVHKEFWDGVNFRRGANPPREEWKIPPQRTAEETDGAFERFAQYVDHIRSIPGVHWVTASDLPVLYPDQVRNQGATQKELAVIAERILAAKGGLDFQVIENRAYSVADQFELLTLQVCNLINGKKLRFPCPAQGIFGPDSVPSANTSLPNLNWTSFRDTLRDVHDYVQTQQRVPARIFIGTDTITPVDFLPALAFVYDYWSKNGKLPAGQEVPLAQNLELLPARRVAKDTPGLFGGWVIHKDGFRAPKLMEVARLQAWTLKPAMPAPSSSRF